jgi:Nucleotidyl transferase AbiEii toxin, Type IV TA system
MPVSGLHRQLAAIALGAAARYGFALAGGNALIAHGVVNRFTADVDLFTDEEAGVVAAAEAVEAALTAAGFRAERRDKTGGLADIFPDIGGGLAEWIVTAPTGEQTMLQMAYFERDHRPVTMDVGPVLSLEDVLGSKVCALDLLTELPMRALHILGQVSDPVTTVLDRDLTRKRTRPGGACYPAGRGVPRDRVSVGALPAG